MRIITGTARGRRLQTPAGFLTRPMLDQQKQRLFDILGARAVVDGVYDLFAGSGGLGLEALSRGAGEATFVERDRAALECLKANVTACRFQDRAHVVAADALRFDGARCRHAAALVFADPPFTHLTERRAALEKLLASLGASARVLPGATLVWRIPTGKENVAVADVWEEVDRRDAGRSVIFIYEKRPPR